MLHFASQRDADAHIIRQRIQQVEIAEPLDTTDQQDRLVKLRAELKALDSPVYKLPDVLLVRIFELVIWSHDVDFDEFVPPPASQTVSRWRRVALSTPHLWSKLTMFAPFRPGQREWLKTAHERSGLSSLEISCHEGGYPCVYSPEDLELVNMLAGRAHSLLLGTPCAPSDLPRSWFTAHLRKVKISWGGIPFNFIALDVLHAVLGYLSACHALEELELNEYLMGGNIDMPTDDDRYTIELPTLRCVRLDGRNCFCIFLHISATPQSLTFSTSRPDEECTDWLCSSPERLAPRLANVRSLTIHSRGITTYGIMQLLVYTPALNRLELEFCDLRALNEGEAVPCIIAPNLNDVKLSRCLSLDGLKHIISAMKPELSRASLTVNVVIGLEGFFSYLSTSEWLKANVKEVVEIVTL